MCIVDPDIHGKWLFMDIWLVTYSNFYHQILIFSINECLSNQAGGGGSCLFFAQGHPSTFGGHLMTLLPSRLYISDSSRFPEGNSNQAAESIRKTQPELFVCVWWSDESAPSFLLTNLQLRKELLGLCIWKRTLAAVWWRWSEATLISGLSASSNSIRDTFLIFGWNTGAF